MLSDTWKLLGIDNSPFSREHLCLFDQKSLSERKRGELGAGETKVITPGKIVPCKCCLPSTNISMKRDFDTDLLLN